MARLLHARLPPVLALPTSFNPKRRITLASLPGLTILFYHAESADPDSTIAASYDALRESGVARVFGVSAQGSAAQAELRSSLALPFELLSDESGEMATTLGMPAEGSVTLAVRDGKVVQVWQTTSTDQVLQWLEQDEIRTRLQGHESGGWASYGSYSCAA